MEMTYMNLIWYSDIDFEKESTRHCCVLKTLVGEFY